MGGGACLSCYITLRNVNFYRSIGKFGEVSKRDKSTLQKSVTGECGATPAMVPVMDDKLCAQGVGGCPREDVDGHMEADSLG